MPSLFSSPFSSKPSMTVMKKSNPSTPTSRATEAQVNKATPKPATIGTPSLRDILVKTVADLKEGRGSTATSIYNYFTSHFRTGDASPSTVNKELHRAVEDGLLKHPEEMERDRYELGDQGSASKVIKQVEFAKKLESPRKVQSPKGKTAAMSPLVKTKRIKRIGKLDREIKILETPGGTKIARIGKKPETPKEKSPVRGKSASPVKREVKKGEEIKPSTPAKRVATPSSSPKKGVKRSAEKAMLKSRQPRKVAKTKMVSVKKTTPKKKSRLSLPKSKRIVKTKLSKGKDQSGKKMASVKKTQAKTSAPPKRKNVSKPKVSNTASTKSKSLRAAPKKSMASKAPKSKVAGKRVKTSKAAPKKRVVPAKRSTGKKV
jgi:linker histone H1 and H5 family protein